MSLKLLRLAGIAVLGLSALGCVPSMLDRTFGNNGVTLTDVGGGWWEDEPFTLTVQTDGKFVVPGKSFNKSNGNFDFTIIRYNRDGSLDPTFGGGDGVVQIDIMGGYDEALGLVQQPDGKLVAAGFARNADNTRTDFALARVHADGTLDTTFGSNGRQTTDFFNGADQALGLVIQSDGKIVAGGYATHPVTGLDFALARYDSNGMLDATFGGDGRVTSDFFGSTDSVYRLAIQSDDRVVAAGTTFNTATGNQDFALARYNVDGTLDATFSPYGTAGLLTTDFMGGTDYALTVLAMPDGRILAGGLAYSPYTGHYDFALARYTATGALDETFASYGKKGIVTTDFFGGYDQILALAIQPDGKIVAGGHAKHPQRHFEFALARYKSDGNIDTTFGYGGRFTIDFFGGPDGSHGIALQPDGKVVMAGDAENPFTGGDDFALVRVLIADPSWVAGAVAQLPESVFSAPDRRAAIFAGLALAGNALAAKDTAGAVTELQALREHVDGCPAAPDGDDWITNCPAQEQIHALLDQIITKLGGT